MVISGKKCKGLKESMHFSFLYGVKMASVVEI